jgi:hypothetical protein
VDADRDQGSPNHGCEQGEQETAGKHGAELTDGSDGGNRPPQMVAPGSTGVYVGGAQWGTTMTWVVYRLTDGAS